MIINTELENSAVIVMKDGRQFDVNIIGENLETLQTYLRTGRVGLSLLDYSNKDDAIASELILEETKLYVKLKDGSVRPITAQADDDLEFLINNLLEVSSREAKPKANTKLWFRTSAFGTPKDLQALSNDAAVNKYVLYADEKPTDVSPVRRSLMIPYIDIDHIDVPLKGEDGNYNGLFISLNRYIKQLMDDLDARLEVIGGNITTLNHNKEDKQYNPGVNLITPSQISQSTINNFKDGLSVYRLKNDGSGSNGWQNILNTLKVKVGGEAILTVKVSPIKNWNGTYDTPNRYTGGLYCIIEPVDNIREADGNYRVVEGMVKRGDTATTIEWVYTTPKLLSDDRMLYGSKFNRGSTVVTSVKNIRRSGHYLYNNGNPGSNDAPVNILVDGTDANGAMETQGLIVATVSKISENATTLIVAMTFISNTTGYTYHTKVPMTVSTSRASANDLDWTDGTVTRLPEWTKMLHGTDIQMLIRPGDTPRTAHYLGTRNLNAVLDPGFYYQNLAANTVGNNYPVEAAGSMLVMKDSGISQFFMPDGGNGEIYKRSINGANITAWSQFMANKGTYEYIVLSDWIRSTGNTGWKNTTHGGEMWMQDSSWIRFNKGLDTGGNEIKTSGTLRGGTLAVTTANVSGQANVGTTNTTHLYVNGWKITVV